MISCRPVETWETALSRFPSASPSGAREILRSLPHIDGGFRGSPRKPYTWDSGRVQWFLSVADARGEEEQEVIKEARLQVARYLAGQLRSDLRRLIPHDDEDLQLFEYADFGPRHLRMQILRTACSVLEYYASCVPHIDEFTPEDQRNVRDVLRLAYCAETIVVPAELLLGAAQNVANRQLLLRLRLFQLLPVLYEKVRIRVNEKGRGRIEPYPSLQWTGWKTLPLWRDLAHDTKCWEAQAEVLRQAADVIQRDARNILAVSAYWSFDAEPLPDLLAQFFALSRDHMLTRDVSKE